MDFCGGSFDFDSDFCRRKNLSWRREFRPRLKTFPSKSFGLVTGSKFFVLKKLYSAVRIPAGSFETYSFCTPFVSYSLRSVRYTQGLRIPEKCYRIFPPRQKNKITCRSGDFVFFVGAPGFEPGVTRSQSEHVSRYTTPRFHDS